MRTLFNQLVLFVYTWSFVWALVIVQSLWFRRKMSHNNGVAARGRVRIVGTPQFPEHEFFVAGKSFPCRIRHASAAYMDDAMLLVRAVSIKFSDQPVKSPFDIEMNTGRSLFWSAWNFFQFAMKQREHRGIQYERYYERFPAGRGAAQDSIARNPSSYSKLDYYSQCPFYFFGKDNVERYARYRLIPASGEIERLVNRENEVGTFFGDQRTLPDETRNRNYLKHEYRNRLDEGSIQYSLQIQLHAKHPQDTPNVFNSNVDWDEETHPWMDLAEVEITDAMDYEEEMLMYFSLQNMPKSLGVIPAKSIHDYNSLNHMRYRADIAKKARLLSYKLFGMPKPLPDIGPRNVTETTCEKVR